MKKYTLSMVTISIMIRTISSPFPNRNTPKFILLGKRGTSMENTLKRSQIHEYQKYCVDFIKSHPVSALFLDCGLGKTIISLTAIYDLMFDELKVSKVLVIAPLRVTNVWKAEVQKWSHLQDVDVAIVVGTVKQRIAAINSNALVYAVNRENVKWLVEYYEKNGLRWDYDMIVIDELSSFKNYQSQRFKWLRKVRPFVKRWVGLTGTPTSNGLMDLWAEIGILDGGERLGRFIGRFRESYFKPASMNPSTGVVFSYTPRPVAEEQIYNKISDITISMKALDYLDMPECIFVNHEVEMNAAERKLYDQLKQDLIIPLEDGDIDAANAASLSNKLLQMANGAVYDENKEARIIHSRKLEMLEDLIEAANGQPVLVGYWFKHDRTRIMEHLTACGYSPRDIKDSADITDWNAGNIPVALIHPASAGHGLNIQSGGHIMIWFGLTWSLELYQQTNARLWRQGQKHTVTIHHIVTKDSVDEDVLAALANKDVTQEKLIAAVKARL
nr:MAG TPA: Chromatin remodeling complex ATPase [Caudoviricetes sp.]